jgi:transcriptional regulator with XRE-family HTH domain
VNAITDKPTSFSAIAGLKALRLTRGYTLEEVAIATGLTVSEVRLAEEGQGQPKHPDRIKHVLR